MLSERATDITESATWIWSKWLLEQAKFDQNVHHFTHYEFVEDKTKRQEVESGISKLLVTTQVC